MLHDNKAISYPVKLNKSHLPTFLYVKKKVKRI